MQETDPSGHPDLDPRTIEAYAAINEATDGLLLHCKEQIRKPYIAIFAMLMASTRIAAAAHVSPEVLHAALDAMYDDSLVAERQLRGEH